MAKTVDMGHKTKVHDPENFKTRGNERIIKTLDVKEMLGMYTTQNVVKKWTEDYLDEDTNETISIERTEILFRAHTEVTQDVQQKINFYIIEGSITEPIELSSQNRTGLMHKGNGYSEWMVTVYDSNTGKNRKLVLKAKDPVHAIDVVSDYMETRTKGSFRVIALKHMDRSVIIDDPISHMTGKDIDVEYLNGNLSFVAYCDMLNDPRQDDHPDEDNRLYWKIVNAIGESCKGYSNEDPSVTFIVHSVSVDAAQKAILRRLTEDDHKQRDEQKRKLEGEMVYTLSLQEATQLNISDIVPIEYTKANEPKKNEEE